MAESRDRHAVSAGPGHGLADVSRGEHAMAEQARCADQAAEAWARHLSLHHLERECGRTAFSDELVWRGLDSEFLAQSRGYLDGLPVEGVASHPQRRATLDLSGRDVLSLFPVHES